MLCFTAVLDEFGKLRKANISYDVSVIPHGLTRLSIGKKNMKSDIRYFFSKICRENSSFTKI